MGSLKSPLGSLGGSGVRPRGVPWGPPGIPGRSPTGDNIPLIISIDNTEILYVNLVLA